MRLLAVLPLLALVLAGCGSHPAAPAATAPGAAAAPTAYQGGVPVALPAALTGLQAETFRTGFHRGEPTVGATSDGTLWVTASDDGSALQPPAGGQGLVGRSTDSGKTWAAVQDPLRNAKADVDPWLWVDPVTDRVFNAPLYAGCSWLAWTDDGGRIWDGNPTAGCGFPGHDHQKLTTGPPPSGVTTSGYPDLVYYAYNSVREDEGTMASVSRDGGRTFALPVQAHVKDSCQAGINGPVAVDAQGIAYLPKPTCNGVAVAVSRDGGAAWGKAVLIDAAGMAAHLVTLHAAVDGAGTVYVAWTGADELLHLSFSADHGTSWSAPTVVSAPGLKSVVFSALAAGDAGRIGLLYVATDSDPAKWSAMDPSVAPDDTVWHAYLAVTHDATSAAPTFAVQRLDSDADPVQRGCVWLSGGTVACRNLRDFIDLHELDGRLVGVYADGCDRCTSAAQRTPLGESVVVVQQAGPSLRAGASLPPFTGRQ